MKKFRIITFFIGVIPVIILEMSLTAIGVHLKSAYNMSNFFPEFLSAGGLIVYIFGAIVMLIGVKIQEKQK